MKLYILNRLDLPPAYRACQAGHAIAEWMLHETQGQKEQWNNHTLIYLGIKDEEELKYWGRKLDQKDIQWIGFKEPDIGHQLTAIACYGDGKVFSNLPLIKD